MKIVMWVGGVLVVASFLWMIAATDASQAAKVAMLQGEMSYVEYTEINYKVNRPITLEVVGIAVFMTGLVTHVLKED